MFLPIGSVSHLNDNFHRHILFLICYMFKVVLNLTICSSLIFIVDLQSFIKLLMINCFYILNKIVGSVYQKNIVCTVFFRDDL